jgi:DnaK suppressor protein
MTESEKKQLKEELLKEKERILDELSKFSFKNKEGDFEVKSPIFSEELDEDTESDEAEEFGTLLSLEKRLEEKISSIENALLKFEKGNFGACESCGKEIEVEKLKANPSTTFCIKCRDK